MEKEIKEPATNTEEMPEDTPETTTETAPEEVNPNSELEALRAENEQLKVFQNKVRDLAETDEQAAAFLHDLITTGSIGVALTENYSEEEIQALLEEAKSAEYEEHRNNYAGRVGKKNVRKAELEANIAQSNITLDKWAQDKNIPVDELYDFLDFWQEFLKDANDNKLSEENWDKAWKAYKYDGTVAELENKVGEAEENGKIAGRNEKIVQGKKDRESLAELLPETNGGGAMPKPEKKKSFAGSFMDGVI